MDNALLWPPLAFTIVLVAVVLLAWLARRLAFKQKQQPAGLTKPYACGEETPDQMVQPDYGQFFPFALFFTILHVVVLMLTTWVPVPLGPGGPLAATGLIAGLYVVIALVGLSVLYRR